MSTLGKYVCTLCGARVKHSEYKRIAKKGDDVRASHVWTCVTCRVEKLKEGWTT